MMLRRPARTQLWASWALLPSHGDNAPEVGQIEWEVESRIGHQRVGTRHEESPGSLCPKSRSLDGLRVLATSDLDIHRGPPHYQPDERPPDTAPRLPP